MFLLKLILNYWSREKWLKSIQKLEFSGNGVRIIKTLSQDRGNSSFEFLDSLSKFVEIIVELSLLNIHDIIFDFHELILEFLEFFKKSYNTSSQSVTFGVTNFNFLDLTKLNDGASEVLDVLTSLKEGVKSNKESISSNLPLILALSFVLEVGILEFVTDVNAQRKFAVSLFDFFTLYEVEDFLTIDLSTASSNNCIADLSDENN